MIWVFWLVVVGWFRLGINIVIFFGNGVFVGIFGFVCFIVVSRWCCVELLLGVCDLVMFFSVLLLWVCYLWELFFFGGVIVVVDGVLLLVLVSINGVCGIKM